MKIKKVIRFGAFAVLVGYAIPGQTASGPKKPKKISYKEASEFESALLARASDAPKEPKTLYLQPVNKAEACKLPTTQDQIDRPNLRAYWDGECKNGFAFGLGRDIQISDTSHLEEITIHDGTGDGWPEPGVDYDYVNNTVNYGIRGSKFPEMTILQEKMVNPVSGFDIYRTLSVTDENGKMFIVQTSAFQAGRILWNARTDGAIAYKFTDNSAAPVTNQNAATSAIEVVDPKSNRSGVAVVTYANGAVQNFRVSDGKSENVIFPSAYMDHLHDEYQEILNGISQASAKLQRAEQIEREYLFKACNGKGSINGLDNSDYTRICTWRDQFRAPYATASANYQRQLERLKQQAVTAEQQRQIQQQIYLQQQALQQQMNQQAWNQINQANQQLQQQTQQATQGVNSWQAPQVQPVTPPAGNKVICQTVGSITTCR